MARIRNNWEIVHWCLVCVIPKNTLPLTSSIGDVLQCKSCQCSTSTLDLSSYLRTYDGLHLVHLKNRHGWVVLLILHHFLLSDNEVPLRQSTHTLSASSVHLGGVWSLTFVCTHDKNMTFYSLRRRVLIIWWFLVCYILSLIGSMWISFLVRKGKMRGKHILTAGEINIYTLSCNICFDTTQHVCGTRGRVL